MRYEKLVLFMVFIIVSCWNQSARGSWFNGSTRAKRIVPGQKFESSGRDGGYDSLRWFVWIGNARDCDIPRWVRLLTPVPYILWSVFGPGPGCFPTANNLECGGSLITPWIISTACHCLANAVGSKRREIIYFSLRNHFLEHVEVFLPEKLKVEALKTYFIKSNAFYIHPKCGKSARPPHFNTYDFGWIYLESAVDVSPMKKFGLAYAPAYVEEDLPKHLDYIQTKEAVCLEIGFGGFKNDPTSMSVSEYIRYGWVWTQNKHQCFLYSFKFLKLHTVHQYEDFASWVCQREFHHDLAGRSGGGDSGSPLTCGNIFSAQVSSVSVARLEKTGPKMKPRQWYMHNEAIASAPFMFASNHRRNFEDSMMGLGRKTTRYRQHPETWTTEPTHHWIMQDVKPKPTEEHKEFHKSCCHDSLSAQVSTITAVLIANFGVTLLQAGFPQ